MKLETFNPQSYVEMKIRETLNCTKAEADILSEFETNFKDAIPMIHNIYMVLGKIIEGIGTYVQNEYRVELKKEDIEELQNIYIKQFKEAVLVINTEITNHLDIISDSMYEHFIHHFMESFVSERLLAQTFHFLRQAGYDIKLENIAGVSISIDDTTTLDMMEKVDLMSMYEKNLGESPSKNSLLEHLHNELLMDLVDVHRITYHERLLAFVAFSAMPEARINTYGLNVDSRIQGKGLGSYFIDSVVDAEAQERILNADCDISKSVSSKYIETGWVGYHYWDDNGSKIVDICRDENKNKSYWGKTKSIDQIFAPIVPPGVMVRTAQKQSDLPLELLNQGYVLTRLFKEEDEVIAVFEKAQEEANDDNAKDIWVY
jgi:hypothetical protein